MSDVAAVKADEPSKVAVVKVPGPRFLHTILSSIGLIGGLFYVIGVGTEWGVLALVGVIAGALLLLALGFILRINGISIEADEHDMILRPYPLRIGLTRRVPRGDIGGFLTTQAGSTKAGTPCYALTMLCGSRRPQQLAYYDTEEEAARKAEETLTAFFT